MKTFLICFALLLIKLNISFVSAQPGSLDHDFSGDGIFTFDIDGNNDIKDIAIQPDQKIIALGNTNSNLVLMRLSSFGDFDNSFGTNGIVNTKITGGGYFYCIKLQTDNKILVGGASYDILSGNDFTLVRFNSDGSKDNSFSSDGIVTTAISDEDDFIQGVAIQKDGKIVVAGYMLENGTYNISLARYNTDGTLDNTFGTGGIVIKQFKTLSILYSSFAKAVEIQPDGKIVVTGRAEQLGHDNVAVLLRFNSDGTLDPTFNSNGVNIKAINNNNCEYTDLIVQPDNKIACVGRVYNTSTVDMVIARYNSDGIIDSTFGTDGVVCTDISSTDNLHTLAIQTDNKYVAAGNCVTGLIIELILVRYNNDGSFDTDFGDNGIVRSLIGSSSSRIDALAIQENGRIIAGGNYYSGTSDDFMIMRYLSGLSLGTDDLTTGSSLLVYPNPLNEQSNLNYTLNKTEVISLKLFDLQGRLIITYFDNQIHAAGKYNQALNLPANLANGTYFLILSTESKRATIQLIK